MELREFLAIRRAYALVRKSFESSRRVSFAEFAILCCLANGEGRMHTTDLAAHQDALRPTMTHRTKHLEQLGLIERQKDMDDRRSVTCAITPVGRETLASISEAVCGKLRGGTSLSRVSPMRMLHYVDSMGFVACSSADLILLSLLVAGCPQTIANLVTSLGLMQPTISMAVMSLESSGFVYRVGEEQRLVGIALSNAGMKAARALSARIADIVVRRSRRSGIRVGAC